MKKTKDPINPDHYKAGGMEVIDILRAKLSPEEFRGFLKGNAIKYITRAEAKGREEDYKKAAWYTSMLAGVDPVARLSFLHGCRQCRQKAIDRARSLVEGLERKAGRS